MAYQGGIFSTIPDSTGLPGARINVVSKERATAVLSPRGIVAVPMELDWGLEDEVKSFVAKDYTRDALYNFGFDVGHEALVYIDELFQGATEALIYRLNCGGTKATSDIAEARYSGVRGNDITITVEADPDAGMTTREYAGTKAKFSASENVVTVDFSDVPDGYSTTANLLLGDEEVESTLYSVLVEGESLIVTLDPSMQSGTYDLEALVTKGDITKLIATASVGVEHEDATVARVVVTKDSETKNSNKGEALVNCDVTFIEDENTITAKYIGVPEGYKISAQLKLGSALVAKQVGRLEEEVSSDSIMFKFFKDAPMKAPYTFVARVQNNDTKDYTVISTQIFNVQIEGEDKPEIVTASVKGATSEDYSGEIPARFIVKTFLESQEVDKQKPKNIDWLKDNDFVVWNRKLELSQTAGTPLTGGTNGTVTVGDWATALDKFEPYNFHILACPNDDEDVKTMFIEFTRKMRDEMGVKFQTVTPKTNVSPNYEGIIQPENEVDGRDVANRAVDNIYWIAGQQAGCKVQDTVSNTEYEGNFLIDVDYTQRDLERAKDNGYFTFHRARGIDRAQHTKVLLDINTLTEYGETKDPSWSRNQTIRVIDQACNDIAAIFNNNYFGKVPNRLSGREQLKNDIIQYFYLLETIGAIDAFDENSVIVEQGPDKVIVVVQSAITPVNAMEQMYMTIYIA